MSGRIAKLRRNEMLVRKFEKQDYSLVGAAQNVVGLNDELMEERVEGTCGCPTFHAKNSRQ
jgi:hypothetical protein